MAEHHADGGGDTPEDSRRGRFFWPALVVGLLAAQVSLLLLMVYVATSDGSFAVEPDYYQKGLHWDATAQQLQANRRLGWSLTYDLAATAGVLGDRELTCTLQTADGTPLDGAQIELVAFAHARGNDRHTVTLQPAGDGHYHTTLRFRPAGLWELRFTVHRGPEVFTSTQRNTIRPPGEN